MGESGRSREAANSSGARRVCAHLGGGHLRHVGGVSEGLRRRRQGRTEAAEAVEEVRVGSLITISPRVHTIINCPVQLVGRVDRHCCQREDALELGLELVRRARLLGRLAHLHLGALGWWRCKLRCRCGIPAVADEVAAALLVEKVVLVVVLIVHRSVVVVVVVAGRLVCWPAAVPALHLEEEVVDRKLHIAASILEQVSRLGRHDARDRAQRGYRIGGVLIVRHVVVEVDEAQAAEDIAEEVLPDTWSRAACQPRTSSGCLELWGPLTLPPSSRDVASAS